MFEKQESTIEKKEINELGFRRGEVESLGNYAYGGVDTTNINERAEFFGIGLTNYSGLRFRSPVYRSLRELVMSYFDVYYNLEGEKSLRSFSRPVDLSRFDARGWETAEESLWDVSTYLGTRRFTTLLARSQARALTPMDRRLYDAGLVGTVR